LRASLYAAKSTGNLALGSIAYARPPAPFTSLKASSSERSVWPELGTGVRPGELFSRGAWDRDYQVSERMVEQVDLTAHDLMPCAVRNAAQTLTGRPRTDIVIALRV
jgi:hypothetical protein